MMDNTGRKGEKKKRPAIELDEGTTNKKRLQRNECERQRRVRLTDTLQQLDDVLPVYKNGKRDRPSILRHAVSFLQLYRGERAAVTKWSDKNTALTDPHLRQLFSEVADGFVLVIGVRGLVVFVSPPVTSLLGHDQRTLLGGPLTKLIQAEDAEKFLDSLKEVDYNLGGDLPFPLVMSFHNVKSKPRSYTSYLVQGVYRRRHLQSGCTCTGEASGCGALSYVAALCRPVSDSPLMELFLSGSVGNSEFVSHHRMDGSILWQDHRVTALTGLLPMERVKCSVYDLLHMDDLKFVANSHNLILRTGRSPLTVFRLRTYDGFVYCMSSSVVNHEKLPQDQRMIASVNYILDEEEGKKQYTRQMIEFEELCDQVDSLKVHSSPEEDTTTNPSTDDTASAASCLATTSNTSHERNVTLASPLSSITSSPASQTLTLDSGFFSDQSESFQSQEAIGSKENELERSHRSKNDGEVPSNDGQNLSVVTVMLPASNQSIQSYSLDSQASGGLGECDLEGLLQSMHNDVQHVTTDNADF